MVAACSGSLQFRSLLQVAADDGTMPARSVAHEVFPALVDDERTDHRAQLRPVRFDMELVAIERSVSGEVGQCGGDLKRIVAVGQAHVMPKEQLSTTRSKNSSESPAQSKVVQHADACMRDSDL